jgi:perosamine synthetase
MSSETKVRRIPVCEPVLDGRELEYVTDCVRTAWVSSMGKYINAFEEAFAKASEVKHGVACVNGTIALHLAMVSMGIGPGDEVIIPDFTLIVSANTVILSGAKPVLVDVDRLTGCIDPAKIEEKITPRTKAIMAVHMYGHPCDMDPILAIARKHGLKVIEDAAEAHGARYKGKVVGGIGDVACFSFYGNKNLTTGEGGMVTTNDDHLADRARFFRNQAFEEPRFHHSEMGFNYRLTNLQAAIGLAQTEKFEEKGAKKRTMAARYTKNLSDISTIQLPHEEPWAKSVYWMYGVVLKEGCKVGRDEAMKKLDALGVETRAYFWPMHRQPVYMKGGDVRLPDCSGSYPVSDWLGERGFYLPSGLSLTDADIDLVSEILRKVVA